MFKLALRNIFRHRGRTGLTLAAIMTGVIALILSGGFIEDIFVQLRESTIHSQLGHIQIYRMGYREYGHRAPYHYMIADASSLLKQVSAQPHVIQVARRLYFFGLLSNGRADLPINGEAVEPDKEARIGSAMALISGRLLSEKDRYGVMVGEGVAAALHLQVGDDVTALLNTPQGALNSLDLQVVGVFRTISKDYDAHAVRLSLHAAQELLLTNAVHVLVIGLDNSAATDQVVAKLRAAHLDGGQLDIEPWYVLADFYRKTVDLYRRQFAVLQGITLILVLLGVNNSINMAMYERTGEFGAMLALGNRSAQIRRLIRIEALLLGVLGSGLGVLAGVLIAVVISMIGIPMPPPPNMNEGYIAVIRMTPGNVMSAFMIGWVATLLAALLPAWRTARLPIVVALRHNI